MSLIFKGTCVTLLFLLSVQRENWNLQFLVLFVYEKECSLSVEVVGLVSHVRSLRGILVEGGYEVG